MNPEKVEYTGLVVPPSRVPLSTGPQVRPALPSVPTGTAGHGIVGKRTLPEAEPDDRLRPLLSFHSPCDATAGTSTSSNGGPTVRNVGVHLLFWGSSWNNNPSPTTAQVLGAVNTVLSDSYMTGLIQYGVGPGSLKSAGIVTGADPSNPFSDGAVQGILAGLFAEGAIPGPGPDDLYLVIAPANYRDTESVGGLHSYVAVLFSSFPVAWYGWVTHSGTLDSLMPILTHELAEAVTDPGGNGIQVNPRNSSSWREICDVCCSTFRLNGVLVESYWSDRDQACIVPSTTVLAAQGSIVCFGVDGDYSRVYYLDTNSNVSELAWDGGWGFADPLTGAAGAAANAPVAVPGGALACFGVNGSASRVYYLKPTIGTNLNVPDVAELYWDNGWGYNILTGEGGEAGAPSAAQNSALACFGVDGSASRVYYTVDDLSLVDNITDVYELYWDNGWGNHKLTGTGGQAPGAPSPVSGSALACFGVNGSASRVYYLKPTIGTNLNVLDVAELYWENGWAYNILTGSGGQVPAAPAAVPGSPLACFGVNGSASRVYYLVSNLSFVDPAIDVYELYWDNGWGYNKLTGTGGQAPGAPSALLGGLACFGVNGSASRVYYTGPNHDIYELYWDNGWGYNKLTGAGGKAPSAPPAAPGSALTCFGVNGSASRVYYIDADGHVNELAWLNGGWVVNRLL